jgi:hypothetical protein
MIQCSEFPEYSAGKVIWTTMCAQTYIQYVPEDAPSVFPKFPWTPEAVPATNALLERLQPRDKVWGLRASTPGLNPFFVNL